MGRVWALIGLAGCSEFGLKAWESPVDPEIPSTVVETTPPTNTTPPLACPMDPPAVYAVQSDPDCRREPVVGTFTPVVEWAWTVNSLQPGYDQVMSTPIVANLTDDDSDGDIDQFDQPDIVFTSFAGIGYRDAGAITVLDGRDGATLFSLRDVAGVAPQGTGGVAVGDLEGDGMPDIVFTAIGGVVAIEHDGSFKWFAPIVVSNYAMPALADLDGDGLSEVVVGATVLEHDGAVRWIGTGGTGGPHHMSFPLDIDSDGLMEVIAGNTVYEVDGTIRWQDGLPDGYPAAADFDGDGLPEFVRVYAGVVHLADTDGAPIWTFALSDGGGGPPTIADFDGDGAPEIGVASREVYRVLDTDGTELWSNPVQDYTSSITGSAVFDFEGDGAAEVVYADEATLWIYDGATGAVELAFEDHSSGTLLEYPVIVDVDGDGSAEIVVASNDYLYGTSRGITVIGDQDSSWAAARPLWNQHAYHITNVEDDGGIPVRQQMSNSFRAGNSETAQGLVQSDLRVSGPTACLDECASGSAWLWVAVENAGQGSSDQAILDVVDQASLLTVASFTVPPLPVGRTAWFGPVRADRDNFGLLGWTAALRGVYDCHPENDTLTIAAFPCPE